MNQFFRITALLATLGTPLAAQAPATPPPATAPPTAQRPAVRSTPTATGLGVQVTDKSGNGIDDVAVALTGPVDRSGRTAADGSVAFRSLRAGTYRLRFEHERYITLEREVVVGARAADVSVALNPAPVSKAPIAPPAPVAPAPVQQPHRAVEPRTVEVADFIEKNFIKSSEPQKMSVFACTDGGTARLVQVKEPLSSVVNQDADQVLYVVAGSGIVRVRDQEYKATSGLFALIPRGVPLGARRDGRNPLIALLVTMGVACTETAPLAR